MPQRCGTSPLRRDRAGCRGVTMAGFRERATDLVDLRAVPYPAVTVAVDLGDGFIVDDASGRQQLGSVVAGLSPSGAQARGRCALGGRGPG
jgi:hypothetical protein